MAFVRKELFGVYRQPRLILGLIVGPFLVLALFGLGYNSSPTYKTILVLPDKTGVSTNPADYSEFSKQAFKLTQITTNQPAALASLDNGEADVVIVVPPDTLDTIYSGKSASFPTYYRNLNPVEAGYIEYSSYVYASELDRIILREALNDKDMGGRFKQLMQQRREAIDNLDKSMQKGDLAGAKNQVLALQALDKVVLNSLDTLILPGGSTNQAVSQKILKQQITESIVKSGTNPLKAEIENSDKKLVQVDNGLNTADLNSANQKANIEDLRQSNDSITQKGTKLANIPPGVLVEPIRAGSKNLSSTEVNYINFFGPALLIMVLQHLGLVLVALSTVRERLIGTIEIYRIAPISPVQILIGKFLGFMTLLLLLGGLLLLLITQLLGVPYVQFDSRWVAVLATIAVTIYASIGLGVLVSGLARTESQAIQWSMLVLLASIFFTGFIVPLNQFTVLVHYVSYLLPMTFGAAGLQESLLDTLPLDPLTLLIPLTMGTLYFMVGFVLYRRQFKIG
jgi:ABC-2 type transport system permease protein